MGGSEMKKKSFLVGGLVVVLLMVLVTVGCTKRALQDNSENVDNTVVNEVSNTVNNEIADEISDNSAGSGIADPDLAAILATKELAEATALITAIQKDTVLAAISTKYINSLSDSVGLSTNYYFFISPAKLDYYFLVNMPRNAMEQPKRFMMLQQDFYDLGFSLLPVPFEYWKINYAQALQLAEQAGGAKFRVGHKNFEVSQILARTSGGDDVTHHLQWHISYKAKDGSGAVFNVQVHANTADVTIIP